ncbi:MULTISPECIES: hypothetical protein [unclassified Mesorhizobium]|uniref:hypothetical protein n=1 Tax=unclassified Mesorhizobium TaxID=325217 RepID=UPI0003CF29ED|nr:MULTISPECIES: hypothetical protein [unclassified Mesorhizobium]ESY58302.1 hypothetical protein X745_04190 [Mesorhizobium sp. LNJC374B00]ESY59436.1 hypothetical protein X744_12830 [Mesorhizobium sp. LNJC372A00]WJI79506.1 hypothetical protein NLY34_21915 [Mesorhizobium sp. C374B]WJI86041.1 hypothetical protein NLY42_24310 [Mesorhizobium sp. C372A]
MAPAKPPKTTTAALEFEAIQSKAAGFKARDRELRTEQIALEQTGVRPEEKVAGPGVRDWAAALLDGSTVPAERQPSDGEKLHAIITERQALALAIEALTHRENQARIAAAAEAVRTSAAIWRAIVRRRVDAVLELRRANAAAANYREAIRSIAKSSPALICDAQSGLLFGQPIVGDASYVFLEAACKAGFVTRKEITNAA